VRPEVTGKVDVRGAAEFEVLRIETKRKLRLFRYPSVLVRMRIGEETSEQWLAVGDSFQGHLSIDFSPIQLTES